MRCRSTSTTRRRWLRSRRRRRRESVASVLQTQRISHLFRRLSWTIRQRTLPDHRRAPTHYGTLMPVQAADHVSHLAAKGWTWTDEGDIYSEIAQALGGSEVRRQRLRPMHASVARGGTHSAKVGLDAFPWHTDGAIALTPPRWMVLKCIEAKRTTATELCRPNANLRRALGQLTLLVRQENGRRAYIPALIRSTGDDYRIRWDPRWKVVGSDAARRAVECATPTDEVSWKPGRILILDNHRILHRRPAVTTPDGRVIERVFLI